MEHISSVEAAPMPSEGEPVGEFLESSACIEVDRLDGSTSRQSTHGEGSISQAIAQLSADDQSAAQMIWDRFFSRLCNYARSRIYKRMQPLVDPEEVASSAFFALWDGLQNSRFERLRDRDDLWRLLTVLAAHLTSDAHRHYDAIKRGGGKVMSGEALGPTGLDGIMSFLNSEVDPAQEAEFENTLEALVSRLDPIASQVVLLRLGGHSYEEIAERLGIAETTVGRKMDRIRSSWRKMMSANE